VRQARAREGLTLLPRSGTSIALRPQASARLVLTDSGGIPDKATALGVPCLALRHTAERPITGVDGTNVLGGTPRGL
jgi:UDP-N-acetylglucosamine 2-epimerase (non-hydrolysing)